MNFGNTCITYCEQSISFENRSVAVFGIADPSTEDKQTLQMYIYVHLIDQNMTLCDCFCLPFWSISLLHVMKQKTYIVASTEFHRYSFPRGHLYYLFTDAIELSFTLGCSADPIIFLFCICWTWLRTRHNADHLLNQTALSYKRIDET